MVLFWERLKQNEIRNNNTILDDVARERHLRNFKVTGALFTQFKYSKSASARALISSSFFEKSKISKVFKGKNCKLLIIDAIITVFEQ